MTTPVTRPVPGAPTGAARDVAILTPWYPTRELPFRGSFVRAMVDATGPVVDRMSVYHCDAWVATLPAHAERRVWRAQRRLTPHVRRSVPAEGGSTLTYVPAPVPRGLGHADIAERYAEGLRTELGGAKLPQRIVHAHVGLFGGWMAVRNAPPDARIFVTEHASFLDKILADPRGRRMYDEIIDRSAGFLAVGDTISTLLAETYPHHADRIQRIANPIRFGDPRPAPVTDLRRWLYVGSLNQLKGVDHLLEAFARCHAEDPSLTLTLIGEGPLAAPLTARAAELGLTDAVTLTGPLAPDETLRLMREHDLLTHVSRSETFGVAIIEAIAAGMPVLVTRCGGPEQTLAGVEDAAAQFVDVEDGSDAIVEGYRQLRERFPHGLDLDRAQRHLDGRYGYRPVALAHERLWFGADTGAPAVPQSVVG